MCPDPVGAVVLDCELVGWGLQMLSLYHQFDIPWPEPQALQMRFMINTYRTLIQISWIHGFDWFGPCHYRGKIIIPVHSTLFNICEFQMKWLHVISHWPSWPSCSFLEHVATQLLQLMLGCPWMPSWSRCSSATVHIWMHILYLSYIRIHKGK